MLTQLKKIPDCKEKEHEMINEILGNECNSVRKPGLVDVDTSDFDKSYGKISAAWPVKFKADIESGQMRLRPLKDTLLKSMGKNVRIEARLGNPPYKFDNQRTEAINHVIKEAIGHQYVDQSAVYDLINDNVIKPQENEMVKAFCGGGNIDLWIH